MYVRVYAYFETQNSAGSKTCVFLSSIPLSLDSAKHSLHVSFVPSAILVSYTFLSGSIK